MTMIVNANGTDLERSTATSTFFPNPTQYSGGSGEISLYSQTDAGSGDISAEYATYLNRDGISPNGGTGIL
jgi:hypothetical protein